MYIIDNFQDYYDYVSHIYGVDKKIVFDRRKSEKINDNTIVYKATDAMYRIEKDTGYFILETGAVQYLFEITIQKRDDSDWPDYKYKSTFELIYKNSEHKNFFGSPLSIWFIDSFRIWDYGNNFYLKKKQKRKLKSFPEIIRNAQKTNKFINLPYLAETCITSFILPEEIWQNIMNYISSLDNDKDVSIPMTDKAKASVHGFDDNSFRHPIK